MTLEKLVEELSLLLLTPQVGGGAEVRILVTHPQTGENMLFDIEGVDAWDGPLGLIVMVQNFPAWKEPHLKLVET